MQSTSNRTHKKRLPAEVPVLGADDFIRYELVKHNGVCRRCVLGHIAHTFCGVADEQMDSDENMFRHLAVCEGDIVRMAPKSVLDAFLVTMPPSARVITKNNHWATTVDILSDTNDDSRFTLRQLAMWWNRAMKYLGYTEDA